MRLVVKLGTSSVTGADGSILHETLKSISSQISEVRALGHQVILVTSGAISVGLSTLGIYSSRPSDLSALQAISAVGQSRLMAAYNETLEEFGMVAGQVLLTPLDFMSRNQYLHARQTLEKLLELSVVPIVNENDAIADDEIRFGDNDRIAALVANLVRADLLILLTDQNGLYTSDPRKDDTASLVDEIDEISDVLKEAAGGPGTERGSGGMASKLQAAFIASWSGVDVLIASASRKGVVPDGCLKKSGVGTYINRRSQRLSARKLWIAFALSPSGKVFVDNGAKAAILEGSKSLLSVGVSVVVGTFLEDDAIEICGDDGQVIAKGLSRVSSQELQTSLMSRLNSGSSLSRVLVHKDDLVVLA